MHSSKRQRNPHTHDEQADKTDFFSKTTKEKSAQSNPAFFNATSGSVQKKKNIQRLATPKDDEKLGTNDARMSKDKEIQEKRIQRSSVREDEKKSTVQREADETYSESETGSTQTNQAQSCNGWESDPQSLSKRAADHFCGDAFNTVVSSPASIVCSGSSCIVTYSSGTFTHVITVDLSKGPGMVVVSGTPSIVLRPQQCSYSYSCDVSGPITFKRISCQFL